MLERFSLSYMLIALALIAIGLAHYWLARFHPWAGAIVPALYTGFVIWTASAGSVSDPTDVVLLGLGFVALGAYWFRARKVAKSRM